MKALLPTSFFYDYQTLAIEYTPVYNAHFNKTMSTSSFLQCFRYSKKKKKTFNVGLNKEDQ